MKIITRIKNIFAFYASLLVEIIKMRKIKKLKNIKENDKVDVYYNLHLKRLSVKSREAENRGRVIGHVNSILIRNAKFIVQKAGRQRVLSEKKKNVHAFIRGNYWRNIPSLNEKDLLEFFLAVNPKSIDVIRYNPYKNEQFQGSNGPILSADWVIVKDTTIWAVNPVR